MQGDVGDLRQAADGAIRRLDFVEAQRGYTEVRARLVDKFGADHTYIAKVDETLGGILRAMGQLDAARDAFERAHRIHPSPSLETVLAHLDPLAAPALAQRPRVLVECAGHLHGIENDQFFIGRGLERVHLYIPSPLLSRVHARVLWNADRWDFEDCASENGSYLDGARIDGRHPLGDGDTIALGTSDITIRFRFR